MHVLQKSYRGLGLVMELNLDRIVFFIAIGCALLAGAYLAGL
jgi:hypothetical protein